MDNDISETVYGTHEDSQNVMSERVQTLASSIYKEFERMIKKYDEDVVKQLMPLVVGILESLDSAYLDKQENEVELELLRDDNEQLLTQYEREKQLRKASEQKYLEVEDANEEERKDLESKVESLESIVRMFELKAKNAQDHITRLEEKESEMRKEYSKLHERYTELFKTHMDYMERTKLLMGPDRFLEAGASPRGSRGGLVLPNLKQTPGSFALYGESPIKELPTPTPDAVTPVRDAGTGSTLRSELRDSEKADTESTKENRAQMEEKEQLTDTVEVKERSTGMSDPMTPMNDPSVTSPEMEDIDERAFAKSTPLPTKTKRDGNESSIYDELSFQDSDVIGEMDDGVDITDMDNEKSQEEEADDDNKSSVSDNFFGMGKEVENLILENTELLATKNALNVVKDDLIAKVDELTSEQEILREEIASLQAVKSRLKQRMTELEEELKKTKEDLEKQKTQASANAEGDEDDIPMAQRKRFTRVEMARVLMERNQYKERLMELQEAVRWTEMIRASKEHPELVQSSKKKSSIWNFFSNLFSSSNKPSKKALPSATVRYNAPTTSIRPAGDPNKKQRDKYNLGEKAKAYDFLQEDLLAEKTRKEREKERREQYKQVRAHVKKDDGRMQAYGWSLPAKYTTPTPKETPNKSQVPVPVPVYCRPLLEKEPDLKIWCAAGVNLTGGRTRDGGSVVGASVFYSNPPENTENPSEITDDVEKINQELKEHEKSVKELTSEQMSSLVWICTTTHNSSRVTVVDANNPADVLETFHVTSSHILCIASVPGATESDYEVGEVIVTPEREVQEVKPRSQSDASSASSGEGSDVGIGNITLVKCATGVATKNMCPEINVPDNKSDQSEENAKTDTGASEGEGKKEGKDENSESDLDSFLSAAYTKTVNILGDFVIDPLGIYPPPEDPDQEVAGRVTKAMGSPARSGATTPIPLEEGLEKRLHTTPEEIVKDGISSLVPDNEMVSEEVEKMSSVQPTMWMGSQSGSLYVHSAVSQWKRCLHSVKLRDSVLNIVHVKGRVMVALADGSVAVFHRSSDGQWDLQNYHLIDLGRPHHSVRCMTVVANKHVWCGYRNHIHVLDPKTLKLEKTFDAHPRKESQIRQLAWVGDGVWVSIRLDSTLRLYHAYTHQHLQDVDIEPYVSKMLGTGKLGFSFVRITSLLVSCNRLWIGTGNGVIISVPLSENNKQAVTTSTVGRPGGVIRVYSDTKTDGVTPGSFIPYCSMAQAQLSFHGHRDAVKFFVAVPGASSRGLSAASDSNSQEDTKKILSSSNRNMLVISGGEGYIDFRIGDTDEEDANADEEKKTLSKGERSHLIVWHLAQK